MNERSIAEIIGWQWTQATHAGDGTPIIDADSPLDVRDEGPGSFDEPLHVLFSPRRSTAWMQLVERLLRNRLNRHDPNPGGLNRTREGHRMGIGPI